MGNKRVVCYTVEVGYNRFKFYDGDDAVRFARISKQSFLSNYAKDKSEISVSISVDFDDPEDKEEDE